MIILGFVDISIFFDHKEKNIIPKRNTISFSVSLLICYGIVCIITMLLAFHWYWYGHDIDGIIFIAPAVALIIDIIGNILRKKHAEIFPVQKSTVSATSRVISRVVSLLVGAALIASSVTVILMHVADIQYDKEKAAAIKYINSGHLENYPDTTIWEAIEKIAEDENLKLNDDDDWIYTGDNTRSYIDKLLGRRNNTYYLSYWLWNYGNDDVQEIHLDFMVHNGNISLRKVTKNDNLLLSDERQKFDFDYFASGLLQERGKECMQNGIYVSDKQYLYSAPNFYSKTSWQFTYSGTKTVLSYKISDDGKTLWLKLSGNGSDGEYQYFWIPEMSD